MCQARVGDAGSPQLQRAKLRETLKVRQAGVGNARATEPEIAAVLMFAAADGGFGLRRQGPEDKIPVEANRATGRENP